MVTILHRDHYAPYAREALVRIERHAAVDRIESCVSDLIVVEVSVSTLVNTRDLSECGSRQVMLAGRVTASASHSILEISCCKFH